MDTDTESAREHYDTYLFVLRAWASVNSGGTSAEFVEFWRRTSPRHQEVRKP